MILESGGMGGGEGALDLESVRLLFFQGGL